MSLVKRLPKMRRLGPHQWGVYNDDSKLVVICMTRRGGKDECLAARHTLRRIKGEITRDCNYMSRAEETAREWIKACHYYCRQANVMAEIVSGRELVGDREMQTWRIELPGPDGKVVTIRSLACTVDAPRGFDGDVILSEFAFYERPWDTYSAAAMVTLLGGQITIVSTPNCEGDAFEELRAMGRRRKAGAALANDLPVSLHEATIDQVAHNGYLDCINEDRGTKITPDEFIAEARSICRTQEDFDRECRLIASAQQGSLLPYDLTRPCVTPRAAKPTDNLMAFLASVEAVSREASDVVAGVDIGRKRDRFVIWTNARIGGAWRTAGLLVWQNKPFSQMYAAGASLLGLGNGRLLRRMVVDSTGLGMQMGESWRVEHGSHRVEDIQITPAVKEHIYSLARRHIEERTVELPDDAITLADLASLRKEVTVAGKVRYVGDRNEHGHADQACGLGLALHAGEQPESVGYAVGWGS